MTAFQRLYLPLVVTVFASSTEAFSLVSSRHVYGTRTWASNPWMMPEEPQPAEPQPAPTPKRAPRPPVLPTVDGEKGKQLDVMSRLLKDRILLLGTDVNDEVANVLVAQLLYLANEDPDSDITLYINSPGGSVSAGFAIYDCMKFVSAGNEQPMIICLVPALTSFLGFPCRSHAMYRPYASAWPPAWEPFCSVREHLESADPYRMLAS
jgi:hypothetical protein